MDFEIIYVTLYYNDHKTCHFIYKMNANKFNHVSLPSWPKSININPECLRHTKTHGYIKYLQNSKIDSSFFPLSKHVIALSSNRQFKFKYAWNIEVKDTGGEQIKTMAYIENLFHGTMNTT